ncbi:tRNA (uridine(34)/cytosine(34)/5-carboxymethylaminomethyluridine(34)-2'-O)-methyltransferase TrmL [Halospina sp. K52047b]|uniref:tRNA (uridine(34)/cytosine(34)/5- carboxymethylaminomethyluridine(34)-2'-O)- methyltransferase TrmL n=1 Tax=Halospina sp. K52047b TaxID=2614160 RepID=UPI00124A8A17|nr:tRNA (uridine(34)/cytosine(34)/5-carboxymethylaminomethyluridine(34)-2'-O)-methyltransferase TrmL [Halospina sp. K52047b]KAA8978044.1 tRNA (uridine(34)/cytosine(34)/5-carboxymethylaminomethyluridine(34)-2'-O)-methyltransferase TrmL [Halospina sp. K52047b]
MLNIALYEPEIPPNTGNIMRLAASTGCRLHLIQPLGFQLDDRRMKRAGLDYREYASVSVHEDYRAFLEAEPIRSGRLFGISTKGTNGHHQAAYQPGDTLMFGPETRGLPEDVLAGLPKGQVLRLPMVPERRSLNLSNAAAVVVYEAWRQLGFEGGV